MLLFPLHKQYKEVDRSERGLCEKIIKSFRECQESIAQHCQHRGVLQAIIRWHGGGRYVWQLIPAWSPAEKQRAAFTRYQAKWGNKGTGVKPFQCLSVFPGCIVWGRASFLFGASTAHLARVRHSHNPLGFGLPTSLWLGGRDAISAAPAVQPAARSSLLRVPVLSSDPESSNWFRAQLVDCW